MQIQTIDQLRWKNITLSSQLHNKKILDNLNGTIQSGQFLTIMGPSGSGKTTFLQFLTARMNIPQGYESSGKVYINDFPYDLDIFNKFGIYVNQNDILFSTLTVLQTIQFQADLRIKQPEKKEEKVKNIIRTLGLQQCQNNQVGGNFIKSISGGQKRRTSIALQLISDPNCIILDEPTSGLDSHNAFIIIKILKDLAKQNKIVIATLHQPSSRMFHEFDKLMLMNHGKTIYFQKAANILNYMENYLKIPVNIKMNPADFFMYEISEYNSKINNYTSPMNSENYKQYNKDLNIGRSSLEQSTAIQQKIKSTIMTLSLLLQFKYLTIRAAKNWFRNPINIIGKIAVITLFSVFFTLLYHNVGKHIPQGPTPLDILLPYINKVAAAVFLSLFSIFASNFYSTMLVFSQQKEIFYKESSSQLYNSYIYFFTRYVIQLPSVILPPFIVANVIYKSFGVSESHSSFYAYFVFSYVVVAMSGAHYGLIIGLAFADSTTAASMVPIVLIPMVLFGGLAVNLQTLHKWLAWIRYFTPVQYAFNTILSKKFENSNFEGIDGQGNIHKLDYRTLFGLHQTYQWNFGFLFVVAIVLLLIALALLIIKKRKI